MGRDKNVDKKEINIFCVATFSVALCNSLIIFKICVYYRREDIPNGVR